jgi:hypothetical protein
MCLNIRCDGVKSFYVKNTVGWFSVREKYRSAGIISRLKNTVGWFSVREKYRSVGIISRLKNTVD